MTPSRQETLVGALALVVLLTGTVRAVTADEPVAPPLVVAPVAPVATAPPTLAGVLPALEAYVQDERGLRFRRKVTVEVLPDRAFEKALGDDAPTATEDEEAAYDANVATLLSLGLAEDAADVDAFYGGDAGLDGVLGFYDFETERLVVRGSTPTPYVQQTIVHELTHALDDQHFDLGRPGLDAEAALAFRTLTEGNAERIGRRWYDDQPRSVRRQLDREQEAFGGGSEGADEVPGILSVLAAYPYVAGPELVEELLDDGGQVRLDAAFRRPPTTTEQVLDPALPAARRVPVPRRPAGSTLLESDVLGELGLAVLLLEDPLDPDVARGWRGDRYVTYATDEQTCTIVDVRTGSTDEQRALLDAAADLLDAARPGPGFGVTLRGCRAR